MKRAIAVASLLAALACGDNRPMVGPSPPPPTSTVLVGAGDIAECTSRGPELTAQLLDTIGGTVFTAGDNAYPSGSAHDFETCYEPTWGRHKDRTRPTPGNHDYEQPGAAPYFRYFGAAAGPAGRGYYNYTLSGWTVMALNSNVPIDRGSPQMQWLQEGLRTSPTRCTIAMFHHPPFASGPNGDSLFMRDLWRELHASNVDIAIAGHEHLYERFSPQDGDQRLDLARGVRLFVVGTGGARLSSFVRVSMNSSVRLSQFGVLKLTLRTDAYEWQFIGVDNVVHDNGSGVCH